MLNESRPKSIDAVDGVGTGKPGNGKLTAALAAMSPKEALGAGAATAREVAGGPPPIPGANKAAKDDGRASSTSDARDDVSLDAALEAAVALSAASSNPSAPGEAEAGPGRKASVEKAAVEKVGGGDPSPRKPGKQAPIAAEDASQRPGGQAMGARKAATTPPIPDPVVARRPGEADETSAPLDAGAATEAQVRDPIGLDAGDVRGAETETGASGPLREEAPAPASPGPGRRTAKRRPAGVVAEGRAANDDLPSIGGLIFALHQKPSSRPFTVAAIASAVWVPLALLLGAVTLAPDWSTAKGMADFLARPSILAIVATTLIPVAIFWFLAQLVWRAQELRLMSSAMSEVAIRLAEPDRMAEQSIASLGQAVRRQVSFMNEGVTRALGRANELEALVHNEVAALERSYRENEHKIRSLVQELAGERHSLVHTGDWVSDTLRSLSVEVPALIEKLGEQQQRLSGLIESAGQNLIQFEGAVAQSSDRLESTLDSRTHRLQAVLDDYSAAVGAALGERTEQLQEVLVQFNEVLDADMGQHAEAMRGMLEHRSGEIRELLVGEVDRLEMNLDRHGEQIGGVFDAQLGRLAENVERQGARVQHLVGAEADRLESTLSHEAKRIESAVGSGVDRLEGTLGSEVARLETTLSGGAARLEGFLSQEAGKIERALVEEVGRIEGALGSGVHRLEATADSAVARLSDALEGGVGRLDSSYDQGVGRLVEALGSHTDRLEGIVGERADRMHGVLDQYTTALDAALEHRTRQIEEAFAEHGRSLDGLLAARSDGLDQQLLARTRALDEAFAERLRTLDESIVRATTTIDASVGAKAAALTSALETHARQLTEALGRQSRDLDQSVVRSLAEVHRTSEKITLHSVKAIESITGQADMLRNVSENLLQQISGVTHRFEGQGQTIMKAANALEAANVRIDTMLQTRTTELTETLETLAGKAGEFDRLLAGYSTAVEGSIEETEARARALTRDLTLGAQTSSEAALAELERLKSMTDSETNRALDELKARVSHVSREVSEHMGSLTSRFADTSEEMRRRAQKAAGEIAEEQRRIHEQLQALPVATRESAEAMRAALGEQLKALDQLSSLTLREQRRRDIVPPLAAPAPAYPPAASAAPPANLAARSAPLPQSSAPAPGITSLTAAFASETHAAQRRDERAPAASMSALAESVAQHLSSRGSTSRPPIGEPAGMAGAAPLAPVPLIPAPTPAPGAGRARGAAPTPAAQGNGGYGNGNGHARGNGNGDGREAWSVGDLLARASRDEVEAPAPESVPLRPAGGGAGPAAGVNGTVNGGGESSGAGHPFDIETIARALDPATASALWTRLRAGQRGIMVRSIYSPDGRHVFDEVSRRYRSEHEMRAMVDRYVGEFERLMQDVDRKDPSGRLLHGYLSSDSGRVYLFLAHAAGRLG
jgi:hypothetical protein